MPPSEAEAVTSTRAGGRSACSAASAWRGARLRAAVVALQDGHPYMRLPIQFATTLRARILDGGLMTAEELDVAMAGCEAVAKDPDTTVTSFVVTQVWGRKPT